MAFEINLPQRLDVYLLRCAGLHTGDYHDRMMDVVINRAKIPFEVRLAYFLSDPPATVTVVRLSSARDARLRITAPTAKIERDLRGYLERYSTENGGEAVAEREHAALWNEIESILAREQLSSQAVSSGQVLLNRRASETLIDLAARTERTRRSNIIDLFANGKVVRDARDLVARWLIDQFTANPDPFERGQLALRIWENTIPAIGDDLIEIIHNRNFGESRAGLLMALARTKNPRAADVIAAVLHEDGMPWAGLQALAKLKAIHHIDMVRPLLRHRDADVRREAKKTLKKLGFPVLTTPLPVHLVKGKRKPSSALKEWSANLDLDGLEPILKKLAGCVDRGFGPNEIAEVVAVVEEMPVEQTRAFRFPITAASTPGELWLSLFMDDIDAPDLEIRASPALINNLTGLLDRFPTAD